MATITPLAPLVPLVTMAFTFEAPDQGAVTPLSVVSAFPTTIRNTGTATDTYTVTMVKELPATWVASLCEGTVCYPPFVQQISFTLAPGAETNVDVDVTPLTAEGSGNVRITAVSQGQPALAQTRSFGVVTTGVQVLLVDGDGGQTLEIGFTPALASSALSWARWQRHEAGSLGSLELAGFAAVIWFADGMAPALDDGDRVALAYYVQHGGSLLLCGQDLAQQACDPFSPWFSPQTAAWFPVVLGVSYAGPAVGAVDVAALPTAPFARSASGALSGDGGAGNGTSPDALLPTGAGSLAQQYGNGAGAAIASTWGAGRSFFCGYAVESLSPAAVREAILTGFLAWMQGLPSAVDPARPAVRHSAPRVAPNPFNPSTTISFDLAVPGRVQVEVCDLQGRLVRRLPAAERPSGPVAVVWDGRTDAGAPAAAGVYLARVIADGRAQSVKMVLAK